MIHSIGTIRCDDRGMRLELKKEYGLGLAALEGFSHVNILWWFSKGDRATYQGPWTEESPYKDSPLILGTFATRSPKRPNPIGLSCVQRTYVDLQNAVLGLAYIDAHDGTPVLDIKPYTPSLDRVEKPTVPPWCKSWPKCYEDSSDFDWESVFRF